MITFMSHPAAFETFYQETRNNFEKIDRHRNNLIIDPFVLTVTVAVIMYRLYYYEQLTHIIHSIADCVIISANRRLNHYTVFKYKLQNVRYII